MEWINDYQLFLFDFDGLLVNTEKFHYEAYCLMCKKRGIEPDISFSEYCLIAHYEHDGLEKGFYQRYPELFRQEPDWKVLYAEKKKNYLNLLQHNPVTLMPGALELLSKLSEKNITRCVVTHSPLEQIDKIRMDNPILDTIPHWITREDYTHPKPHKECYEIAIQRYAKEGDHIIGFEDTPRGLKSLLQTPAKAVFVTMVPYPDLSLFIKEGALHVESLQSMDNALL